MKLIIGNTTYTALTDLKFDPTADVTGSSVPVNEFSVDVKTTDNISTAQFVDLCDDLDNLWARYWIVYADRMDENTMRVKAQSTLRILERRMLDAEMYDGKLVTAALADIFSEIGITSYTIDESFEEKTLTGFVPDQSAKNRLQWVCFVIGAYIRSFFSETVDILPISAEPVMIPVENTFWKPSLVYGEYVTRVNATAYSYEQGTPGTTDTWVTDGTNYYIQEAHNHSLGNPDLPQGTLTHEVHIEGVTLINEDNVDEVLTNMSRYHFKRLTVEAEVINNAQYEPGKMIQLYTDSRHIISGFIEKADFSFGMQAMSRLNIAPVDLIGTGELTVVYKYGRITLDKTTYTLPLGFPYEIECRYFDQTWDGKRYIFRPTQETITGEIEEEKETVVVQCVPALEYQNEILTVISVDDMDLSEGVLRFEQGYSDPTEGGPAEP